MRWTMKLPLPSQGVPDRPDDDGSDKRPSRPWPLGVPSVVFLGGDVHDFLNPKIAVRGAGARVMAAGGGINMSNGCKGTGLSFLLCAALASVSLSWRTRLAGLGMGRALAVVLNQTRIGALVHADRTDPARFNLHHTTVVRVVVLALCVPAWFRHCQRPAAVTPRPDGTGWVCLGGAFGLFAWSGPASRNPGWATTGRRLRRR